MVFHKAISTTYLLLSLLVASSCSNKENYEVVEDLWTPLNSYNEKYEVVEGKALPFNPELSFSVDDINYSLRANFQSSKILYLLMKDSVADRTTGVEIAWRFTDVQPPPDLVPNAYLPKNSAYVPLDKANIFFLNGNREVAMFDSSEIPQSFFKMSGLSETLKDIVKEQYAAAFESGFEKVIRELNSRNSKLKDEYESRVRQMDSLRRSNDSYAK